ncbi:MAG: hypothetical protein KAH15_05885, partial [Candidatus Marinimicrobia bacterium]|nr:hypothetical protein [Candidatus Neomarinimicrobiota bacterium]
HFAINTDVIIYYTLIGIRISTKRLKEKSRSKKWRRDKKIKLIKTINPDMRFINYLIEEPF